MIAPLLCNQDCRTGSSSFFKNHACVTVRYARGYRSIPINDELSFQLPGESQRGSGWLKRLNLTTNVIKTLRENVLEKYRLVDEVGQECRPLARSNRYHLIEGKRLLILGVYRVVRAWKCLGIGVYTPVVGVIPSSFCRLVRKPLS